MNIKSYDFYYQIRKLSYVTGIWLYGSQARNQTTSQSDIDLAITCAEATEAQWQQIEMIAKESDTPYKIDVVRFDKLSKDEALRKNILKDHIVLFERKENTYPWYDSFLELGESLDQLKEMIDEPEREKSYVKDATIQRFEFCVKLFWKTLKKICLSEQYDVNSPQSTIKKAFELGLITDAAIWSSMLNDRNMTSHTYHRSVALEIYYKTPSYYTAMHQTYRAIGKKYGV